MEPLKLLGCLAKKNINTILIIILFCNAVYGQDIGLVINEQVTVMYNFSFLHYDNKQAVYKKTSEYVIYGDDTSVLGYCFMMNAALSVKSLLNKKLHIYYDHLKCIADKYECSNCFASNTILYSDSIKNELYVEENFGGETFQKIDDTSSAFVIVYNVVGDFLLCKENISDYMHLSYPHCSKQKSSVLIPLQIEKFSPLSYMEIDKYGFKRCDLGRYKYIDCD